MWLWKKKPAIIFFLLAALVSISILLPLPVSADTLGTTNGGRWQNQLPQSNNLGGVWGSSSSDVFAVGDYGTILHYNGSTWVNMSSGTSKLLYSVWGTSSSDVFAVGYDGTILHYNGSTWSAMRSYYAGILWGVWGSSSSDVFAVGDSGTILHYNGNTWSNMSSDTTNSLYGVWGSSSSDIFAVGWLGTILHFNGNTWSNMSSGTANHLYRVWGTSSSDIFAVGWLGTILHFNGITWDNMSSVTHNPIYGIWGTSSSDIFAVGWLGTVLHFNGITWSNMSSDTSHPIYGIWGTSSSDVFAVGWLGTILHYNGSTWSKMNNSIASALYGVWGSSSSDIFAVGADGVIAHYNGITWSEMRRGTTKALYGIWGSSSSAIFAVGADGTILHYNGGTWRNMHSDTSNPIYGIWGTSSSDVFAVGYAGTILHYLNVTLSQILTALIIAGIIGLSIIAAVIVLLVYFLRKRKPAVQPAPSTAATMIGTGRLSKNFFWGSYIGIAIPILILQLISTIFIVKYWNFNGLIHGLENTDTTEITQMPLWLSILGSLNSLLQIYLTVVICIFIYRAWKSIQDGHARTSAGKALGFLFIPIFNYYWIFKAVWGFAIDFNKYVHRHNVNSVPRLPERLFLAFCIVYIICVVLGFILGLIGLLFGYTLYFYIVWVLAAAYYIIGAVIINKVCDGVNALPPLMFWDVDSQRWEVSIREEQSAMRKAVVAEEGLTVSKPSMEGRMIENTSGMGSSASIPIEIKGWNWGAFILTWIWGVSHSVWISLLSLIPFVGIVMAFVLGAKGNDWAWQNKKWDSIEHFKKTQRTWAWWGLGVVVAGIVLYIIMIAIALAAPAD